MDGEKFIIQERKSMNIKENYQQYVSRYASEVAALKRKNTGFITGELLALAAFSPSWSAISHWMGIHRTI